MLLPSDSVANELSACAAYITSGHRWRPNPFNGKACTGKIWLHHAVNQYPTFGICVANA
jgi:hypothetical protein